MVHIALVEDNCMSKAKYLEGRRLPKFYMEDFSVLGFPVTGLERAKELLKEEGYTLEASNGGYMIGLDSHHQVASLAEFFHHNKIKTSLTDIADTFYQA